MLPFARVFPWQSFRQNLLWTIEVNDLFEANLKSLQKIYDKYTLALKKYIDLNDVVDICRRGGIELSENDLKNCFAMAKMAVTDEAKDYKKYN